MTSPPIRTWITTMAKIKTGASSKTSATEMQESSSATPVETQSSTDDRVTIKKFQDKSNAWRDANMWPPGMETILRKEKVFKFLWGRFSYVDEEIDEAISKYDVGNTELIIFWKRVYLDPDLVPPELQIFHIEGEQF